MDKTASHLVLKLEAEDRRILEAVVEATGQSRREVLRWALRFYAMKGPWPRTKHDRVQLIRGLDIGSVGPNYEEAI